MAIYYSRTTSVSRSKGHTSVAAAAYRAGVRLVDARTDVTHDYTRRKGVLDARMIAPASASWAFDVASVWNRAEAAEVRRNARPARELVVALPAELTDAQNIGLAQCIGQDLVDRYAMAVLVAVHGPDDHGDDRNTHAHLLMSTRVAGPDGFEQKVRVLDDQKTGPIEAVAMRARIAARINAALENTGYQVRVDERRLAASAEEAADRGDFDRVVALTRTPMKHQGRVATAMMRRGEISAAVDGNARVRRANAETRSFGVDRAQQLRRVAASRAQRWVRALGAEGKTGRAVPVARRQALRHGAGPVSAITRATGGDAQLLNDQAQLAREAAQGARNQSEAYLHDFLRMADEQDRRLRVYFERARIPTSGGLTTTPLSRTAALDVGELLRRAEQARFAHEQAKERHEVLRRRAAQAQLRTAVARKDESTLERSEPPVWRPMTRRRWADHRRRQRASVAAAEHLEDARGGDVRAARVEVRERANDWRRAHAELAERLDGLGVGWRASSAAARPSRHPRHEGSTQAVRTSADGGQTGDEISSDAYHFEREIQNYGISPAKPRARRP